MERKVSPANGVLYDLRLKSSTKQLYFSAYQWQFLTKPTRSEKVQALTVPLIYEWIMEN
ncbi:hypothetical protein [Emticicia sp. W12TSBA100-4]|uniref:hypothetical protein n=1 Tax=Emticicia sp. W12TSBA100-4 TaxID=3160965 RepID=UPI003305D42C